MIKINLVCVGKVKESYFLDGIKEFSKRLTRFCEFKIIEVKEENYSVVTDATINIIKEKEAEQILPHLKGKVFSLAIEGEKLTSQKFAQKIKKLTDIGEGVITFVIGGSYGLSDSVKEKGSLISFSDMTFPHTMFRLMFTEQLYRAFTIISGTSYHK